jgi:antitoxin component YwqK of YwqJK toxin-antitoxin module
MKRILTIILLLLIFNLSNAQQSDRVIEIVKDLKKVESKPDTIFYGNGKIWWKSTLTTYEYNSETFSLYSGEQIQYYKNGKIANESIYDMYANLLSWNGYDRDGNKTIESVTTEIDSNAENLIEFFESEKHITFKREVKYYKCSRKLKICYLYKEGQTKNGKKSGTWKFYKENGEIKKEKRY